MKKKRWKILVLLGLLFTQTPIGLADKEQSFKSEGVTGFYGTYEYPEAGSSSSEEGWVSQLPPALLKRIKRPLKKMEQLWNSKRRYKGIANSYQKLENTEVNNLRLLEVSFF